MASKFSECFQMGENELIGFYEPWDIILIRKELGTLRTTMLIIAFYSLAASHMNNQDLFICHKDFSDAPYFGFYCLSY